jgi:hypothetical protein
LVELYGVNPKALVTSEDTKVIAPVLVLNDDTPDINELTCDITNAVEAICVVLVPNAAVGVDGMPVNAGDVLLVGVYPNAVVTSVKLRTTTPDLALNDCIGAVADVIYPDGLVELYGI